MYRVCSLQLGPNFVVRLAAEKSFHLRLTVELLTQISHFNLRFLAINIYGYTAVASQILRLRLTVQIQKLEIIGIQINFSFHW